LRASRLETLSAIREGDPEAPTRVAPGLPPEAERAILRCLHKEPSRRWQSMADLSAVLRDLREDSESGRTRRPGTPAAAKRSRAVRWAAGLGLALVAAAAALLYPRLTARTPPGPLALSRLTFDGGQTGAPSVSADGRIVAYSSDRAGEDGVDVWVQHVTEREPARLTHDPGDDDHPSISPDGSRVLYRSFRERALFVVPTLGGQPRRLVERGRLARFSLEGSQVVFVKDIGWSASGLFPMFLVPADGGEPRPFQPEFGVPELPGSVGPIWSPDGRHLLFKGARLESPGETDWWVAPVDGGPAVATGAAKAWRQVDAVQVPCAWYGSHVLMAAGTTMEGVNLHRVRIGPDFRVSGPPEPLTSGTGVTFAASVSKDGRLFVPRWKGFAELWALDPESSERPVPVPLTLDEAPKSAFNVDRAGARVFYTALLGPRGQRQLEYRLRDVASGRETVHLRRPARGQFTARTRILPGGRLLSWEQEVDGKAATFLGSAGEPGRELWRDGRVYGFTRDERRALLRTGPKRLVLRDIAGGPDQPVFDAGPAAILDADLSWDDRWLTVLTGHDDGTLAIQAVPLAGASPPVEVARSDDWLGSPRWSPDGNRLYHLSRRDGFYCVWAQPLDALTKAPRGEPVPVFHAHRRPRIGPPRGSFSISVGRRRLVFSAANVTGDVLMAQLPPD
jgi:dipeptidyl aminopeptidase/acylaminoacyl peptidase